MRHGNLDSELIINQKNLGIPDDMPSRLKKMIIESSDTKMLKGELRIMNVSPTGGVAMRILVLENYGEIAGGEFRIPYSRSHETFQLILDPGTYIIGEIPASPIRVRLKFRHEALLYDAWKHSMRR